MGLVFFLMARPCAIHAYEIGSGQSYDEGCAYEESCWSPSCVQWVGGIVVTAAVIAGIIIFANSDSGGNGSHTHD